MNSQELKETLISYHRLTEADWSVAKKSKDVTVWRRASPEFSGFLYKAEGAVADDPERIVAFLRPGPCRLGWDRLMTSLEILSAPEQGCCVAKYTTAGQLWNIISPREFVDFSYTSEYQRGLLSCGVSVDPGACALSSGLVRGFNHPCGWFCVPMADPGVSLLTGYVQTDLRGLIPHAAVESAMASGLVNFFSDLRRALSAPAPPTASARSDAST